MTDVEKEIESVLSLIMRVDRSRINSPLSDYSTIMDLKTKMKSRPLTSSQLTLIARIRRNYKKRVENA